MKLPLSSCHAGCLLELKYGNLFRLWRRSRRIIWIRVHGFDLSVSWCQMPIQSLECSSVCMTRKIKDLSMLCFRPRSDVRQWRKWNQIKLLSFTIIRFRMSFRIWQETINLLPCVCPSLWAFVRVLLLKHCTFHLCARSCTLNTLLFVFCREFEIHIFIQNG